MPDVWARILRLRGYSARELCSDLLRSSFALPFSRTSVSSPCTHGAPPSGITIPLTCVVRHQDWCPSLQGSCMGLQLD